MLLEGVQLGRYQLLHLLGSGGMGEVYVGEDTHIHRRVAIKVIRAEATPYPNSEASKESARLFQREVRAIAMLDHPHILPLFDYGEENMKGTTLTYMVMPYREEGSLSAWLQQRGSQLISPQEVAHLIRQAAAALSYAHSQKVIHQDVKPSNFLVRNNEEDPEYPDLLLADFGIAKFTGASASMSQTSRGTPTYMAPEQWSGQPVAASDQYALAITAYQLLTGAPPFQGRQEQVMYMHFHAEPKPPSTLNPQVPKDVDAVILQALAKTSEERFLSISAFANAFQQALSASSSSNTSQPSQVSQPSSEDDIRATLAISQEEAQTGTSRTLNLPRGRRITVPIPSGIPDGQVIRFEGQGEPSSSGQTGALVLTISIAPREESILPEKSSWSEDKTFLSRPDRPQVIDTALKESTSLSTSNIVKRTFHLSKGRVALLVTLILLVVGGSIGFIYFTQSGSNSSNIIVANSSSPFGGTLALDDPLSSNNSSVNWNGACQFIGGTNHISSSLQSSLSIQYCNEGTINFSNFAYEVQMTIIQGSYGGIIFRLNPANHNYYYFHIGIDWTYSLDIYNNLGLISNLKSGTSTAINGGLNQSNLIAVVANGNNIDLYVNYKHIDTVSDSTYSQGEIGVAASSIGNPTEVVFSNAKVWTL